jgi:PAS domain-containing protein
MSESKTDMISFSYRALKRTELLHEERELTQPSEPASLTEETIDLSTMYDEDVSSSGSFDLRRPRLGTIEKLLQAIPIPTLLVDESYIIVFANRASWRAAGQPGTIEGHRLSVLFPNEADGEQAEGLVRKVFLDRIPLVAEGVLGRDDITMRGRIHFRSVRIQKTRMMLLIIEDITPSQPLPR